MWFFFDESGDFTFPAGRFDAYTQAVVICPDSKLEEVDQWTKAKQGEWGVVELHGSELSDDQVWEVCRFLRALGLPAVVQATDTLAVTLKDIEQHRLTQAVRLHENAEMWKAAGGQGDAIPQWYDRHIKATAFEGRLNHSEWLQANSLVDLFHWALNKSVIAHLDDEYRPDFEVFRFVLDRKLPGKLASGEKHLDAVLLGYLASNPEKMSLIQVKEWAEPPLHPYYANFTNEADTGFDLTKLFSHGLEFESSHDHAGLQLADVLAYTARRRIVDPANETISWAWQTVKPIVRDPKSGLYIHLRTFGAGAPRSDHRYRGIQTDA